LGSVLEGIPAIVLFARLLFPIARQSGVNDVHDAMVVVLSMGLGLFKPPAGCGLLRGLRHREGPSGCGHAAHRGVHAGVVGRRCWQALSAGVEGVAAVPWLSTGFL
jgi:hypothetical protein